MIPIVTPEEMGEIDRAAPEPVEVLIARAAAAVAREAVDLMGGTYGRRVVVVAGKGNNGNDGRVAAAALRRRGVVVHEFDAGSAPEVLPPSDLVIDAAYGTGFHGDYVAPDPGGAPVLAVDIPSGLDGRTGVASGRVPRAVRTVTFAALKPGLLLGDGPAHCGEVVVADIGLDVSTARAHLVEDSDAAAWIPRRGVDDHKWNHAVWVIGGSPGMTGAPSLCAHACLRGGSGYVRLSTPGVDEADDIVGPVEAVKVPLPRMGWAEEVVDDVERFAAMAVGPGLGRKRRVVKDVRTVVSSTSVTPTVIDGDGLSALGTEAGAVLGDRSAPVVLTPHDGEFERLSGDRPGADRVEATRNLAATTGATVLLKGSTTVVADPDGQVLMARSGDARLATAGTGDVLTGLIAAHLAMGVAGLRAAAAAAHVHGCAARLGPSRGFVASDLPDLIPLAWAGFA